MVEHLYIVGSSGAGKTTIAVNLAAVLAEAGENVALVGYGSAHATAALRGSASGTSTTVACGKVIITHGRGFRGADCFDVCGGENWRASFRSLLSSDVLERHLYRFIIHDIPCDMEELDIGNDVGPESRVLVVTTADISAIAATNGILVSLANNHPPGIGFGGIIVNNITNSFSETLIRDFSQETGVEVIASITRSLMMTACDYYNQTIIEAAPQSYLSFAFRRLARQVAEGRRSSIRRYLTKQEMREWGKKWGEILAEYETGVVTFGAGI